MYSRSPSKRNWAVWAVLSVLCLLLLQSAAQAEGPLIKLTRFISPGELTQSHASEPNLRDCYACHTLTEGIDDALCLKCHKVIKERFDSHSGYHGKLAGRCQACHTEHKGRQEKIIKFTPEGFNHGLSNYPLTGKHAETGCDKCHALKKQNKMEGRRYIGVKYDACVICHENPHGQSMSANCLECHTTGGWTGLELRYSHARDSKYKLRGKHFEANCDKCHKPPQAGGKLVQAEFAALKTDCSQCHADEHKGQLSKQCQQCHSESGWKGQYSHFDHNTQSVYRPDAAHNMIACEKCHKDRRYKPMAGDCVNCHADYERIMSGHTDETGISFKADPHWNRIRCDQCHDTSMVRQPLALYQEKCAGCHNIWYGTLLLDWMKDWFRSKREVGNLLHSAEENGDLPPDKHEYFARSAAETEKIGAHNFQLTAYEWKRLKDEMEQSRKNR